MSRDISNIVFTRNRPLQLEAYLESLYRHMPRAKIQTTIIYKMDLFREQYVDVFHRFSDCIIIEEVNFHNDFMDIIEQMDTRYVLFGTDDVVYYDTVDFAVIDETFRRFPDDIFGFSLRLSPTYLMDVEDTITDVDVAGEKVFSLNWKKGQSPNAKYPFELNSTIYRSDLVRKIMKPVSKEHPILQKLFRQGSLLLQILGLFLSKKDIRAFINTFTNPNTLEGYCYRWCRGHKFKLPSRLYFQKLCVSAIQINRVNTCIDNPTDGLNEHTVEALNEKYKEGYRFDIEAIEKNRPKASHVGRDYFYLMKQRIGHKDL